MTRNLKALGLAFAAMLVMGAIAASAAQAEPSVTPAKYPAWLTAEQVPGGGKQVLTRGSQVVECEEFHGHATVQEPGVGDTSVTLTEITYGSCSAKVGTSTLPVTVNMTGCHYRFHGGVESGAGHFINGKVELWCPSGVTGPDINIYASEANHNAGTVLCTLTVWNSNGADLAGTTTATNTAGSGGEPNDFDLKSEGITVSSTRDGSILCGAATANATFTGEATVTAYEDLNPHPNENTTILGSRIGVTVSEGA